MTPQERYEQFVQAMAEAEKQYGIAVMPVVETEQLGDAVLARPKIKFVQVAGWAEPVVEEEASE